MPSSKQKFSPSVMKSNDVCWLATVSISSSIEIGPAQVLAIKAGLVPLPPIKGVPPPLKCMQQRYM